MFERFSEAARSAVTFGVEEAQLRGDRRIGTNHLLLGLLHDGKSASLLGVNLEAARAAEEALDREALVSIGFDPDGIAGTGAATSGRRLPMTSSARQVLTQALRLTTAERSRAITGRHLLLALLETQRPDAAAELMVHLGIDTLAIRTSLGDSDASS